MKKIHPLSKLVPGLTKQKRKVPRTWTGESVEHAVYTAICDIQSDFINHVTMEIDKIKRKRKNQYLKEREQKLIDARKLQMDVMKMGKEVTDSAWSDADVDFEIEIKAPKPQSETEPITAS